jgi:flagellar biosynthesis protein FlhB
VALAGAIAVIATIARTAVGRLGADIAAACTRADGSHADAVSQHVGEFSRHAGEVSQHAGPVSQHVNDVAQHATEVSPHAIHVAQHASDVAPHAVGLPADLAHRASDVATAVLDLALPLLVAAAVAALVVHVAQTRSLWFPRRSIPGAPVLPRRARLGTDALGTVAIGGVTVGWLWLCAPRLAALIQAPVAAAAAILALVVTLAVAWVVLGVADALVRHGQLTDALSMSREDKREDDRLVAADPRWRAQRLSVMRGPAVGDAVARAAVVLVGDDIAVAIDWDVVRQPVPLRSTTGRGARATQLVALARRHRVAVHRDGALARLLVTGEGPVPEEHWSRLAEIVAAVRGRRA